MTPDVAVVISLNLFLAPVDDTVTAHSKHQSTKVVVTGPFINFLLHNHNVIYKILIFFFRRSKRQRNFPFFFCFKRELNPHSPLTLSLTLRPYLTPSPSSSELKTLRSRELKPFTPPYIHPKARDFIKPLVLTLTLRPPMVSRFDSPKFHYNKNVITTKTDSRSIYS